ncbi:MAG: sigma-54-dependent Fis family transcriptional regulator [Candidatus Eisenbacteria bacterium]|nr:sigma-54-dependent Fis family transcriptional regulator [Candidatus Eisenbacteria bacterium]
MGRALICLDRDFQVVHVSGGLDTIAGAGAHEQIIGLPVERVLGSELFGVQGSMRQALIAGERREGWGASLTIEGRAPQLLSVTAASVERVRSSLCDPRVIYMVVVRSIASAPPTEEPPVRFFAGMTGRSPAMLRMFNFISSLAESEATVLITGESGTGKELVARALHLDSPRRSGPFVAVNCGALPGELLESELFGHVRGAFTGAVRDRRGRFDMARGGTLFLDEVGDLTLALQVKLLRVLQERTFERVGESVSTHTDARIIAATNRDLQRDIRDGRFREDLYYRLRVVPITLPPLRDRREDIEPLALHLLARVAGRQGRSLLLSPDALRAMLEYSWPGNVRELENALEYAVAVCRGQTIHDSDLPVEVRDSRLAPEEALASGGAPPLGDDEQDRERLLRALEGHRWNRVEAARALGISRTTLWRRMRELGLAT